MQRPDKHTYYLEIARTVAQRGTCLRRNSGTIIVKHNEIISTGYTGAPRGTPNCCDIGNCLRNEVGAKSGECYELCRSVHAEMNTIISASRADMINSTMYISTLNAQTGSIVIYTESCKLCKRMIINAGIKDVIVFSNKSIKVKQCLVSDWVKDENISIPESGSQGETI